jgi:oxygen-independent coproporphyrinogen-3 oxidase
MGASVTLPAVGVERVALQTLPPLSLYVHIPWCVRKCPYCDFNSHELKESLPHPGPLPKGEGIDAAIEKRYVSALIPDRGAHW